MHPFADLNAYIDGALDPQARADVDAHLASCGECRTHVAELRATARLIAALPSPAPTRSLLPRIRVPAWLAPVRTLSAVASGLALLVFVISLGSGLTRQTSGAAAPAAQGNRSRLEASGQPALAPGAPVPSPGAFSVRGPSTPNPAERSTADTQTQKAGGPAGATSAATAAQPSATGQAIALRAPPNPESGQSPVIWLALAIAFGAIAIFATWRLRAA